jgi:hypothetical protein
VEVLGMLFSKDIAMHDMLFFFGFLHIRLVNRLLRVFGVTVSVSSHFCLLISIQVHHHVVNAVILIRVFGSGGFYQKLFFGVFFSLCFLLAFGDLSSFHSFGKNFL